MITPAFNLTATERVLPKLALDFTTTALDSRITFTRTGATATRVNSSGYVESVAADTPRFDFSPVTLLCKGLLIEESRTNLYIQSNGFDDGVNWTAVRSSVDSAAATSPDGANNAFKLVEDNTATDTHALQQPVTTTAVAYTMACYAKKAERDWIALRLRDFGGTYRFAYFDLTNGVVGTVGSNLTATIEDAGSGWYRCKATVSAAYAGGNTSGVYLASANGTNVYSGDGSSGVYLWGAQLEAGAFATSYIPTTSAALTRNADVAVMTGTNFSDWYNQSSGTFRVKCNTIAPTTDANSQYLIAISQGTTANEYAIYRQASTGLAVARNWSSGSSNSVITLATPAINQNTTVAIVAAFQGNNFAASIEQGTVGTDTSGALSTAMTSMTIGHDVGLGTGTVFWGHIKEIEYWPMRLTNSQVQAFSK